MVSSASSRCPHTRMLKEKTAFWSKAKACSNASSSPRFKSATDCSIRREVIGHVVAVTPASKQAGAKISLRFDTLADGKRRIPVVTNLRALATMMDVSEAQVPESGPDRGTSEYNWTTDQIGGEIAYHGLGAIVNGSHVVGYSEAGGALVQASSRPGTKYRGAADGNDQTQALWVFSSDACGLHDFPHVTLTHAGRTNPVGEITLKSSKGDINI
jgi:hypothetical protein